MRTSFRQYSQLLNQCEIFRNGKQNRIYRICSMAICHLFRLCLFTDIVENVSTNPVMMLFKYSSDILVNLMIEFK